MHPAAITWARRPPPISRAMSAASTVVTAAASADGSRSRNSDPGSSEYIAGVTQRHERRLVRIARAGCDPATTKYSSSR